MKTFNVIYNDKVIQQVTLKHKVGMIYTKGNESYNIRPTNKPQVFKTTILGKEYYLTPVESKPKMREIYGNALELINTPGYDALCILTNGFVKNNGNAVMGRWIAKQIATLYPEAPTILGNSLKEHGNIFRPLFKSKGKLYLTYPTKDVWWNNYSLDIIKSSAEALSAFANSFPNMRILLPRPGCGNGGLDWKDVKPILENILPSNVVIITYPKS